MVKPCSHFDCKRDAYSGEDKCIFHCDKNEKNGWYELDENVEKKWDYKKVKEFWVAIREKMEIEKNNEECAKHDFSYFVFPEFEKFNYSDIEISRRRKIVLANNEDGEIYIYKAKKDFNFFYKDTKIIFEKEVRFGESTFLGNVYFSRTTFSGDVYFSGVTFLEKVYFSVVTFLEKVYFWKATFSGRTDFWKATFLENSDFWDATFSKEIYFGESTFSGKVDFLWATFSGRTDFNRTTFLKEADIFGVLFSETEEIRFEETKFNGFNSKINKNIPTNFQNIIFSEKVLFRKVDLSRVSFLDSDIEKVKFDGCSWGKFQPKFKKDENGEKIVDEFIKSENREMIWDEYNLKDSRNFWQKYLCFIRKNWREKRQEFRNKVKNCDYKKIEAIYRQLKKNFDNKSDFQTADDFYCGEMEMRGKALIQEAKKVSFYKFFSKNYGKRFLLKLYKLVSNYNLDPTKSFICLVITILVFTILFYFAINGINLNSVKMLKINSISSFISVFKKPIHYSFTSSTPLLSFPAEIKSVTNGWILLIHYFQKIFSTIIWTLLILSIRRKFKR